MRLIVGVLACAVASAVTIASADPPAAATAATSATASATPTPAAAPAVDAAKPDVNIDDKALLAAGYKPEMKDGQKVWCRHEKQTTGSRVARDKETCSSAEIIKEQLKNAREMTERSQHNQLNKQGG